MKVCQLTMEQLFSELCSKLTSSKLEYIFYLLDKK